MGGNIWWVVFMSKSLHYTAPKTSLWITYKSLFYIFSLLLIDINYG